MKKYDYVLVGSGLFNGVFAYLARQNGKEVPGGRTAGPYRRKYLL